MRVEGAQIQLTKKKIKKNKKHIKKKIPFKNGAPNSGFRN
jgi:hypothetical protein